MLDAIHDRPRSKKVRLQMGAMDSVPKSIVQGLVHKALKESSINKGTELQGQVSVVEGNGADLVQEMLNHHLDLVVANTSGSGLTTERLFSKMISKSNLVVVGSAQFQSYKLYFPKSLDRAPMILPNHSNRLRNDVEHFFEKNHIQPQINAEAQDISLMIQLAINNHGLLIVSRQSVEKEIAEKSLILIGELEDYFEEIWLLSAERKIKNPLAEFLMD